MKALKVSLTAYFKGFILRRKEMEKTVTISGKDYRMVANALVPRVYRKTFNRDMLLDMDELIKGYNEKVRHGKNIPVQILTIFENVAWIFLKQGGEHVGNSPDEWLESLDGMFSVYEALPQVVELWNSTQTTTSTPF